MKDKSKTHKGAAKRLHVTGNGKIKRTHNFVNHILEKRSASRMRKLHRSAYVAEGDERRSKKMLPYA